jgi:hypothetical protein
VCTKFGQNPLKDVDSRVFTRMLRKDGWTLIFTTKFNDSSILVTIISCDYLNLSLADEHVGDVTIPTQVIEYSLNFLQAD